MRHLKKSYAIAVGSQFEGGFALIGPFDDLDQANWYALMGRFDPPWQIVDMLEPCDCRLIEAGEMPA